MAARQLQTGARSFPRPSLLLRTNACSTPPGREVGRYSVTLRAIRSAHAPQCRHNRDRAQNDRGAAQEVRFPCGFPTAITLNEDVPFPAGSGSAAGNAGRIWSASLKGLRRNATDVYDPPVVGATISLGPIGSPTDYRVVVVNGDCEFGNATGLRHPSGSRRSDALRNRLMERTDSGDRTGSFARVRNDGGLDFRRGFPDAHPGRMTALR